MSRSPFRQDHASSARLLGLATGRTRREHSRLLHGDRDFGWPMLALRTSFAMGAVRHALSQRVVAGTMTILPPFLRPPPVAPLPATTPPPEPAPNRRIDDA